MMLRRTNYDLFYLNYIMNAAEFSTKFEFLYIFFLALSLLLAKIVLKKLQGSSHLNEIITLNKYIHSENKNVSYRMNHSVFMAV